MLGWGHVAEAFKLSRELGVHQHGPQALGKQGQGSAALRADRACLATTNFGFHPEGTPNTTNPATASKAGAGVRAELQPAALLQSGVCGAGVEKAEQATSSGEMQLRDRTQQLLDTAKSKLLLYSCFHFSERGSVSCREV